MEPSIFTVDYKSRVAIWEQLVECVCNLVLHGVIGADEQLPSVRAMSAELAINPNTIQKAYAELERRGIIYSLKGRGSFISSDTASITDKHREELLCELDEKLREARRLGAKKCDVAALIDKIWEETNG